MTAEPSLDRLRVKIFADGADLQGIVTLNQCPLIRGFTTNPTLMAKSGIVDYERFAHAVLESVTDKPISFEVFSDDFPEMIRQGRRIAKWGENVYVKIPITNTAGESSGGVVRALCAEGVKVNVTAVTTPVQAVAAIESLESEVPACISVFAGRIADTGRDPMPLLAQIIERSATHPQTEIIWASPRQLLNIFQADAVGCHIITVTADLLAKLPTVGRDLEAFSLDTVRMFRDDAVRAGFSL